jgi:hypothetical protein
MLSADAGPELPAGVFCSSISHIFSAMAPVFFSAGSKGLQIQRSRMSLVSQPYSFVSMTPDSYVHHYLPLVECPLD